MQAWFVSNKSYLEIAQHYGVTRQRIEQIFNKYFAPFMDRAMVRRRKRIAASQAANREAMVGRTYRLDLVRSLAEAMGLEFRAIANEKFPNRVYHNIAWVNDYKCGIQVSKTLSFPNPCGYRGYWRFAATRDTIERCDFMIFIAGATGEERIYIVPSSVLLETYSKGQYFKHITIPNEEHEVYNNHGPKIDYWEYLNSWDLLGAKNAGRLSSKRSRG